MQDMQMAAISRMISKSDITIMFSEDAHLSELKYIDVDKRPWFYTTDAIAIKHIKNKRKSQVNIIYRDMYITIDGPMNRLPASKERQVIAENDLPEDSFVFQPDGALNFSANFNPMTILNG